MWAGKGKTEKLEIEIENDGAKPSCKGAKVPAGVPSVPLKLGAELPQKTDSEGTYKSVGFESWDSSELGTTPRNGDGSAA